MEVSEFVATILVLPIEKIVVRAFLVLDDVKAGVLVIFVEVLVLVVAEVLGMDVVVLVELDVNAVVLLVELGVVVELDVDVVVLVDLDLAIEVPVVVSQPLQVLSHFPALSSWPQ